MDNCILNIVFTNCGRGFISVKKIQSHRCDPLRMTADSYFQVNHLRCLHEFVEAQAAYYKQCHLHMQELQKELGR